MENAVSSLDTIQDFIYIADYPGTLLLTSSGKKPYKGAFVWQCYLSDSSPAVKKGKHSLKSGSLLSCCAIR